MTFEAKRLHHLILAGICLVFATSTASGGGFGITQQSARNSGMGDIGLASVLDQAVLGINPASLGFTSGTMFAFGTTVIMPDLRFVSSGQQETKMQSQVMFPPSVSLTHSFGNVSVGLSAAIPFAYRTDWPENWPGANEVVHSEMRVVMASAGLAFRLSLGASLGVAVNAAFPRLTGSRALPGSSQAATSLFSFDGNGAASFGFSAGLLLQPSRSFTLGMSITSAIDLDFDNITPSFSNVADSLLQYQDASTIRAHVKLPPSIGTGLSFRPFSWLLLEGSAQYVLWSSSSITAAGSSGNILPSTAGWKNVWSLHMGAEIEFGEFALRGGFLADPSPISDAEASPSLVDAAKRGYTLGMGYWVATGLRLDFAYQNLQGDDRILTGRLSTGQGTGSPAGTYTSKWTIIGLNVSYFWD